MPVLPCLSATSRKDRESLLLIVVLNVSSKIKTHLTTCEARGRTQHQPSSRNFMTLLSSAHLLVPANANMTESAN